MTGIGTLGILKQNSSDTKTKWDGPHLQEELTGRQSSAATVSPVIQFRHLARLTLPRPLSSPAQPVDVVS